MTVEAYNGTPAQSQVERDKTVATDESSLIKSGAFKSVKIGNHYRISKMSLLAYFFIAVYKLFITVKDELNYK